jgi:heme-degrading monooxygenase HmoA
LPGERTAPGVRSQRRDIDVVDGFISVVRYRRLSDPNTLLSLSTWRDDEAVARWRARTSHRVAQQEGRSSLFADYRLRIAAVVRDYGMFRREQAPIV